MKNIQDKPIYARNEYFPPQIIRIALDHEISLALQSEPPIGPGEGLNNRPEYFNNDPYHLA